MSYLCLQNPFYTVQKLAGLLELGYLLRISITDIISKNWYEQIFSLWPVETIFLFHWILHVFDFYQFAAGLKQCKTPFYNLANIFVALQL